MRYPIIRICQDIFSGYLKDSSRISQRYLPRRYPQISFDIFILIFLCIFLLIYVYLFAYPEISFFLSALYPWYIFLFIFQHPYHILRYLSTYPEISCHLSCRLQAHTRATTLLHVRTAPTPVGKVTTLLHVHTAPTPVGGEVTTLLHVRTAPTLWAKAPLEFCTPPAENWGLCGFTTKSRAHGSTSAAAAELLDRNNTANLDPDSHVKCF